MGKCVSKPQKNKKKGTEEKRNLMYYKPKISSNVLLGCRLTDKAFKEIKVLGHLNFQTASLFRKLNSAQYLCIGGLDNGEQALIVNTIKKEFTQVSSPPMSLAYGNMIYYENKAYIIGSLTIEASGQEKPAPPLCYDILQNKWNELANMPLKLALCGSYLIGKDIYVIGGYQNYPEYPNHFKSILIYDILNLSWKRSNIETPIFQGIPACCVINSTEILVIGGHDPCDIMTDVESKSVFLFNGTLFEQCPDIPPVGQLRFQESPVYFNEQVFIYSDDDILFVYNLKTKEWSYIDYEQSLINSDELDLNRYQTVRTYLYRYIMEECEIVEYNISFGTSRKTGPSSFKYSFKYTGMCLLEDGRLLFAGGITEEMQATKSTWSMNPKLGSSSNTADLPYKQYAIKMLCVDGLVYAVSGIENIEGKLTNHSQTYLPSENKWEEMPVMEYTSFLPAVSHFKSKIFVIGGRSEGDIYFIIQAFLIETKVWEVVDIEYPCSAYGIGAVNFLDKVLCFGGKDPNGFEIKDSYFFNGTDFEETDELPSVEGEDSTFFLDPCINSLGKVYAVSVSGVVYAYISEKWSVLYS